MWATIFARFRGDGRRLTNADVEAEEKEEQSLGFQFITSQVDGYIKTLARVEISTLQADEAKFPNMQIELRHANRRN